MIFDPAVDVRFGRGQHVVCINPRIGAVHPEPVTGTGIELLHCVYLSREWVIDHMRRRWARMPEDERIRMGKVTEHRSVGMALRAMRRMRPWTKLVQA